MPFKEKSPKTSAVLRTRVPSSHVTTPFFSSRGLGLKYLIWNRDSTRPIRYVTCLFSSSFWILAIEENSDSVLQITVYQAVDLLEK